ncbi:unnamed protein product [Medioppia subpectinata]|uniref:Helicase domino n=1 Tax=Medioppia subpectinata TaxID=1979941 RepID=A0A7R9KE02_9ACAR|nr:unnamed protein product [Medioppia subpectinata]CAG2100825.1 unnamed protein product [Medioppia subpectinata]
MPSTPATASAAIDTDMSGDYLMTHLSAELRRLRESYLDHILELYLLETNGNLIDFYGFRKRLTAAELIQYLRSASQQKPIPDDEIQELISLKLSLDVSHQSRQSADGMAFGDHSSPAPSPASFAAAAAQVMAASNAASSSALAVASAPCDQSAISTTSLPSPAITQPPVVLSPLTPLTPKTSHSLPPLGPTLTPVLSQTASQSGNRSAGQAVSPRHPTRQHSISSFYDTALGTQDQIVEKAKQEAHVVQRVAELRKNGLWSGRRLPKVQEPMRRKTHWDYLLEEMQWLATDFAQERKWKKAAAKKCAKMVMKYHSDKQCFAERAEREELLRMKKIASNIAKQVKTFWSDVEKVFEAKQEVRLKEKRKKLHDMHLNLIVDKADRYTERLTAEFGKSLTTSDSVASDEPIDNEFEPENSESDDEETIAKEEEEVGVGDGVSEIELLQKESEIPLEDLLPKGLIEGSVGETTEDPIEREDNDFKVSDEELVEDEEETIEQEEEKEGAIDHSAELKELDDDMNVPIEELLAKMYGSVDRSELDSDDDDIDEESEEVDNTASEECDDEVSDEEDMSTEEEGGEIGMEFLINPDANHSIRKPLIEEVTDEKKPTIGPNREITDIAGDAESLQPKGINLSTVKVCTNVPFLIKHELREYQHIGLDWLAAMQDKKLNGILADEMGLGKTIQTIALIAHLATEKGIWGPHLIVVPTSVMLNWEMEFKKWCPALKILTYYGSPKERKLKRQGWTKPNQFHVCITSYKLVIQDHTSFRRKKWKYLILDEAQHIKNFKSQRWQMLLNFNTSRRLLLTGTPLQNNLMELWSLMHFLMPNVFQSHKEFKDWFVNPVTGMVEGNSEYNEGLIRRLHKVLRPFLLRRLKCDVEKQLPKKYEHVVMCHLSKRQRFLYEEFMSLRKTKETLMSGNFLSVINILMQLRKVCNHPNLFDPRPTVSPFMFEPLTYETASLVTTALDYDPLRNVNLNSLNLILSDLSFSLSAFAHHRIVRFMTSPELIQEIDSAPEPPPKCPRGKIRLQIRTSTMHSANQSPKPLPNPPSLPSFPATHRNSDQKFLMSPISKTPTTPTTTSSADGNRVAIPLGRLVQTPTGPHILLRTSTATPVSSTIPQSIVKQSPMRQIIVRAVTPNAVGAANSQESVSSINRSASVSYRKPSLLAKQLSERKDKLTFLSRINQRKCCATALYASDLIEVSTINNSPKYLTRSVPFGSNVYSIGNGYLNALLAPHYSEHRKHHSMFTDSLNDMIKTPDKVVDELKEVLRRFICIVPRVMTSPVRLHASHLPPSKRTSIETLSAQLSHHLSDRLDVLQIPVSQMRTQFPELRLIQYDCGKLQTLNRLLWDLKTGQHRVLIFTQMSRMLDIFEQFLNHNGHTYLRLDGTTKIEQRQALMERFNADKRIFCFILSTRSGGVGVNLTGADTVIFYDSDWNPTMDAQAQDRCHRIGQTRDVHIYRLISEMTIEENILKKAQQKKLLGSLAIEGGNFTTAFFKQNAIQELFGIDLPSTDGQSVAPISAPPVDEMDPNFDLQLEQALGTVEEDNDVAAAKTAGAEAAAEFAEFDENIPLDVDNREEEKSPEEEKIDEIIHQLTPVEKYAMKLLEVLQESVSFEQLKQAEEEIEAHKQEWELRRIDAEKDDALRREEAMDEDREPLLTVHREDAYNQLTPVEKYAMKLLEVLQESVSFEQLKQAEEEIEAHKQEWELRRIDAEKDDALRREEAMDEDREPLLTVHREDAYNQVYISYNGYEQMPIWAPPTPPQDENDLYIDYSLGFLYEQTPMPESLLPPIYVPKESNKRLKLDTTIARKQKARKEEGFNIPRSLFDRPSTSIIKIRRELILQKMKIVVISGPENAAIHRTLNALSQSVVMPPAPPVPPAVHKAAQLYSASPLQESIPKWAVHEDWAVLHVLQYFQDVPQNLAVISPGHQPNWDLVSDVVNLLSCNYRSPKLCRYHYDTGIVPREEGKSVAESSTPKPKQKKLKGGPTPPITSGTAAPVPPTASTSSASKANAVTPPTRPIKTSQLIVEDNNLTFSQLYNQRFETIKQIANKRTPTLKHMFINPTAKNPKHIALLSESGINFEQPISPIQVAINRAERISREKQKAMAEQQLAARQLQQQMQQKQQQSTQIKTILSQNTNIQTSQQQLTQAISAKMSAINQSTIAKGAVVSQGMPTTAAAVSQLNLSKALSHANITSQQLPQPILSQISVSPQQIGSTTVTNTDGSQQTCSVVSVATLPPQVHSKIMAVSPVNQIGGHPIGNRMATPNQQIYKQIFLRHQQQQQHVQRQPQPQQQIQMQAIPQAKQMSTIAVGQQQRFQITATVAQSPIHTTTQSLIGTQSGVKALAQTNVVSTMPVSVPMSGTPQRIGTTTTTTGKPMQQIITRTITDPVQMAQIIKRQQMSQQSSGNLPILVHQPSASHPTQASQSQTQLLQNPVTFVKTLSSPATLSTQSLTIPITMAGMNIFTSPVTKVMSPTASGATTTAITSVSATQLRQIQLLQQKRPQQSPQQIIQQQQQLQSQLSQQLGQQTQQKVTAATIAGAQVKGTAQIQSSPVGTFQILHQSSPAGQSTPQAGKHLPTTVTMQQLQQAINKGFVLPQNISHAIHVSQAGASTTAGATLIQQSLLQAVAQSKTTQVIESSQHTAPIAVTQITPNQQTVKHIQVVSSGGPQAAAGSATVAPKSIIISGQPTILQTTSLQSQPQTVTFAIRAAQSAGVPQTQTVSSAQIITTESSNVANTSTTGAIKMEVDVKEEGDANSGQNSRQSPYATRHRNTKN